MKSKTRTIGMNLPLRSLLTVACLGALAAAAPAWGLERVTEATAKLCTRTAERVEDGTEQARRTIVQPMAFKLIRGVSNLTLGWIDLPKQIVCIGRERGWLTGVTRGTIDGVGMSVARILAGAYEIVTFPLPVPPRYQPMVKPDHVWQPEPTEPEDVIHKNDDRSS